MDLLNLEIFQTVAQELSITRAAKRLNRAQSNISTRIQQLEKQLNTTLFLRDSKQIQLTRQGQCFLFYSEQMLALAKQAQQALHPSEPSGTLYIGSMESTAASRLPHLLADFQQRWQKVELQVTTAPSLDLLEAVNNYRLDCAFLALDKHELAEDLTYKRAFTEELLLIIPQRYQQTPLSELPISRLACFRQGCSYRRYAQQHLPLKQPLSLQEVGSYHAIIACVAAGSCIGVLPKSVLQLQQQPAGISAVSLGFLDTWLVWRKTNNSAALQQFSHLVTG